jgi:hypothetical protein
MDGGERARAAWEVTAGLVPGQAMPEYTRRWVIASSEWYGQDGQPTPQGVAAFNAALVGAQEYARYLMNPGALNWVRVDWIWF